jgi:hypothetical protein
MRFPGKSSIVFMVRMKMSPPNKSGEEGFAIALLKLVC